MKVLHILERREIGVERKNPESAPFFYTAVPGENNGGKASAF